MNSSIGRYSTTADFVLSGDVLNVYLPVLDATKELIQQMWDMKRPDLEYFDTWNPAGSLVAVEWKFEDGPLVLKKLGKKVEWQKVFK